MNAALVLAGIVLCAASGLPALLSRRLLPLATPLIVAGSLLGLAGAVLGLGGDPSLLALPWHIPGGAAILRLDALSAFFAAPVFLLAGAGGLFASRYWPATRPRCTHVRIFFGVMTAALALVMCAGNTIFFLAGWELVAVTSFLLIATEHEQAASRTAAWVYFAASHVATLALFAIVAILHSSTGGWSFAALPHAFAQTPEGRALFWLAVLAFGTKAGLMPLHVWLPGAHAAAPTHVSAVMSGAAIKMGIYGLVRVLSLYDTTPGAFGTTLLLAGIASSILGVAFALAQHDLKRLLAYHSIENIGIIVTGLGIGLLAQSNGQPLLALLGYAGALLHVWNHGLFKALLFLSAGSAIHGVHTREIDRMGGLAKRMPWTAAAFVTGAVAISGLPPMNGFVSEWLLYVAGFRAITLTADGDALLLVLVVPALALTGALALACFVKAFGAVFLGAPRSGEAGQAHESPLPMLLPMLPLGAACAAIGILPLVFAPAVAKAVRIAAPSAAAGHQLSMLLRPVQAAAVTLFAVAAAAIAITLTVRRRAAQAVTWDCGYAAPDARMQYTSSSLARTLLRFFAWAMPPVVHAPRRFPLFPRNASFESHVPDTVLDRALLPAMRGGTRLLGFARYIQHGRMQLYLLYLVSTLVVLLAWSAR